MIELATELGRVICIPDPEQARARDEQMAPLVPPGGTAPAPPMPGISGGILADTASAGELFIQATVRAECAEGRLDDVIGAGWHLVTNGPPVELDGELASWFGSIGGRTVAIGTTVEDVEDATADGSTTTASLRSWSARTSPSTGPPPPTGTSQSWSRTARPARGTAGIVGGVVTAGLDLANRVVVVTYPGGRRDLRTNPNGWSKQRRPADRASIPSCHW